MTCLRDGRGWQVVLDTAVLSSCDSVVASRLSSSGLCTSVEARKVGNPRNEDRHLADPPSKVWEAFGRVGSKACHINQRGRQRCSEG